MSDRQRRTAGTPEGAYADFAVGARVMTKEGFPGVIDEVQDAPFGTGYLVTLDNGMGGGSYAEGELSPLNQTAAATASEIHTADQDYPELGTILTDRLPIRPAVPAGEYLGGRVLAAKTADLYYDTPASDLLYEAASYVMSSAAERMGHLVTALTDWDELHQHFWCEKCGWEGDLTPTVTGLGTTVDICPGCGDVTPYEAITPDGWPVAARRRVADLYLPPTNEPSAARLPDADDATQAGYNEGYTHATTINARQPSQNDAAYRSGYDLGWAEGVKNVNLHPGGIPLTDTEDLLPVTGGLMDFIKGAPPKGQEVGQNYSYDWCRFRRSSHCYYPRFLDDKASAEAGYAVWIPEDRGMCPRITWEAQKACPAPSQPGPKVHGGYPDATVSWEAGGQRDGDNHNQKVLSVAAALAARDPLVTQGEFRFHMTAAWSDVRAKAKAIRAEGGVRVVEAKGGTVVAHVRGDSNVYETRLVRMPGSKTSVANWECGCAWAAYAWGRSPAYRRFEGRMCSHALATQYEAQARGMFGREIREDARTPTWMDPTMPPKQWGDYDRDKARHSGLRPVAHVEQAPALLVAAAVQADGGDALAATAALIEFGVRDAPLVAQAGGTGTFLALVRGVLTELHIRAGHILDKYGDAILGGRIEHPDFDPRRGLSLTAQGKVAAAEEAHNGDDAEVTYWAHQDQAGLALLKHVHTATSSTYFYLNPFSGQWTEDPYWSYVSVKGSTSTRVIDRAEMHTLAAAMGFQVLADLSPDDLAFARALETSAAREEQRVTPRLKALAAQYGGEMRGLKFRLKGHIFEDGGFTPAGRTVAGKIEKIMAAKGANAEQAARGISDALRYTMTFPDDTYAEAVPKVLRALEQMGYVVVPGRAKNYWTKGDPYDGINCTLLLPSGLRWELQFHTKASFKTKQKNHDDYQAYSEEPDPAKRKALYDRMVTRMAAVPKPKGVMNATKWMRREFEPAPVAASLHVTAEEFGTLLPGEPSYDAHRPVWVGPNGANVADDTPEPALPVAYSEDDDADLPAMWAAAAKIELALRVQHHAGCSACGGSGEQGTGHECYICDGSGSAAEEAASRAAGVTNDNPENGLPVGLDLAAGQAPVTGARGKPGDAFEHNEGDQTTREYHDHLTHQVMPDGQRYPYDKPAYDKSQWGHDGPVMDEDDWKRLKHSGALEGDYSREERIALAIAASKGNVLESDTARGTQVSVEALRSLVAKGLMAETQTPDRYETKYHNFGQTKGGQTLIPGYTSWTLTTEGQALVDQAQGKTSTLHLAADAEHADGLSKPVKVGDEWVIYADNGREVARSTDKKLLEDYRLQRDSARIAAALSREEVLPIAQRVIDMFALDQHNPEMTADALVDQTFAQGVVDRTAAREELGLPSTPEVLSAHDARLANAAEGVQVGGPDPFAYLLAGSGGDSEIAAAAKAFLAKTALKDFTPAERAQIIDEGMDVEAANLDRLDITGTHYVALEDALAAKASDDDDHTLDGMMWL